jgi:gluconate 2-dehydrogenase gamma chain
MTGLDRRSFLRSVGAASLASASAIPASALAQTTATPDRVPSPQRQEPLYLFFNAEEAAFIEAACERLIPPDETGPGALEAWVPNYLDKQLGGAWGSGERLYRSGPWQLGTPSQGYQLPLTPAELFRTAIRAINGGLARRNTSFKELPEADRDAYLQGLERGGEDLDGVPSEIFFQMLLQMSVEGYFADPVYGGNKDMLAWKMIGFPGAYADYYDLVDKHGVKLEREPMSIGSDRQGSVHVHPEIPASI